jgi:hypothetical protein
MATFPRLKTGALAQYPLRSARQFRTSVVRFLDGTEQRWRNDSKEQIRWVVRLDLLDEAEARTVREFFLAHAGQADTFTFEDPVTGEIHPHCRFASDTCEVLQRGEQNYQVVLPIRTVA